MPEFATRAELVEHYKAVSARIRGKCPPPVVRVVIPPPKAPDPVPEPAAPLSEPSVPVIQEGRDYLWIASDKIVNDFPLETILGVVSQVLKRSLYDLKSARRGQNLAHSRMVYYHVARTHSKKSWPKISALVYRHHSTAIQCYQVTLVKPERFAKDISAVVKKLEAMK